jgi:tetratricopeptide (TPR) repeat protein
VHISYSSRLRWVRQVAASAGLSLLVTLALSFTMQARGQDAAQSGADGAAQSHGRILLVLPFDNRSGQPSLEWIREAAPEILGRRFASAGFAPMRRADRLYALDHLGLPEGFHPSRASSLKLAQTLDADSIIVGSYITDGTSIEAEAQLVDVPHLRMSQPVTAKGEMRDMISVFNSLAWKLTRELDPSFSVAEQTFIAAGSGLRLDAFEQYIRGISEPDQQERLRHLKQAVVLSPAFGPSWMALGREDYIGQQYEQAADAFAKVSANETDALEAGFYRGLSLIFSGDYSRAEEAFASVARVLPLAEVLNNQGVTLARRGKDGVPLFRKAVAADPNGADYHFNLAVSLKRHGENAEALTELAQSLKLRPGDTEAQALQRAWTGQKTETAFGEDAGAKADPLERIMRTFDAAAFRQAALMMDQMDASRLEALSPHERAQKLAAQAKGYLDRGLLLEAERLYLSAAAADNSVAEVHAGLAELRERSGDAEAARREATRSLELMPSADAYLVLGRLNLAAGHLDEARQNVEAVLKIDANNNAAQQLRRQIDARQSQTK